MTLLGWGQLLEESAGALPRALGQVEDRPNATAVSKHDTRNCLTRIIYYAYMVSLSLGSLPSHPMCTAASPRASLRRILESRPAFAFWSASALVWQYLNQPHLQTLHKYFIWRMIYTINHQLLRVNFEKVWCPKPPRTLRYSVLTVGDRPTRRVARL